MLTILTPSRESVCTLGTCPQIRLRELEPGRAQGAVCVTANDSAIFWCDTKEQAIAYINRIFRALANKDDSLDLSIDPEWERLCNQVQIVISQTSNYHLMVKAHELLHRYKDGERTPELRAQMATIKPI